MAGLKVLKTYKLYIGGQFPRSESGRYYELRDSKKKIIANVCLGSRKDFRNAVVSARSAQADWAERPAFNRGQILYRIAEMMQGRRSQFIEELVQELTTQKKAEKEVDLAIDRMVYYAGWCDKFQAIFSAVNPVASSHYNFSLPEPTGIVAVIAPEESGLLGLVSVVAPIIVGANTCIVLVSEKKPLSALTFAEVLAHADLPPGVVNLISGKSEELHQHFSSHMDVNAIVYCRKNKQEIKTVQENCSLNIKRFLNWMYNWNLENAQNPYLINDLQEIKTTWHPIEKIGISGAKY